MMDGITGTQANIVGKVTMMYKQYKKVIDKHKKDIDNLLNLICELCNKSYVTVWDEIKYCPSCIDDLEHEMNKEMFGE